MYRGLDEQTLARYCSQKDRLAEEELYKRYAARVYTLCGRYVSDDEEAKDLMQESIISALDKIQTFHYTGKGSLYGWIGRIAINKAIDHLKRRKRWAAFLDMWAQDNTPEPTEEDVDAIPQEKILEWIARLPDMRRTVFNLYCFDGYTHKEIGEMLGISEKGSAGVLSKARKQLKGMIRNYLKEQGR